MEHYFDISVRHTVSAAGKNHYKSAVLHPNRTMPEHDFVCIIEGTWKIGQDGEEYETSAGDVLILEAGRSHYGILPCSAGTRTAFIHAAGLETDRLGSGDFCLPSLIKTGADPRVRHFFEKTVYAKLCGEETLASIYFDTLLLELKECADNAGGLGETALAERMRRYIAFADGIPTNYEIAERFNVSLKTAEQSFKKAFGKSIHSYLLEIKTEKAKQYLFDFPNMCLYEIAEALGFYDEFHFSRQFKKVTGLSPSAYRLLYV